MPSTKYFFFYNKMYVILILSVLVHVNSLSVVIPPATTDCFYEPIGSAHYKIGVQYQVVAGGHLDIDLHITSPSGNPIHNAIRQTEGNTNFMAYEEGDYKICFSNQMSTLASKTILFEVVVGDWLDWDLRKSNMNDTMQAQIERLEYGLRLILFEQKFYRKREESHRDLAEETNAKVVIWSLIETGMLIASTLFQVFFLRQFFTVKR
jgi:hypothetical protein